MRVYKHESSTPDRIVLVLRDDARPGFPVPGHALLYLMRVWHEGTPAPYRVGSVQDVWVRPDLRGQGYGRMLMEAVIKHARQLCLRSLTLTSNPSRAEARRLYETLGFRQVTDGFRLVLDGSVSEADGA